MTYGAFRKWVAAERVFLMLKIAGSVLTIHYMLVRLCGAERFYVLLALNAWSLFCYSKRTIFRETRYGL